MEDHYGIPDLRQLIGGRPLYTTLPPPPPDLHPPPHPYNMVAVFRSDSTNTSVTTANTSAGGASSSGAAAGGFSGFEMEAGALNGGGGGGGGRWPRQETLTLLEIRSRLDPSFKEANQKGPLWDEVSRIMSEENGYQRSGKKCREKFENLYKYYKKTKDGKAGRQDGKHYRFFRQLEALYGETNNSASAPEPHLVNNNFNYSLPNNDSSLPNNYNNQEYIPGSKLSDTSLSLSNFSEYETTSSDDSDQIEDINDQNDADKKKKDKKRSKRNWKIKIKDFIDGQMRKLMDKQEVWMEKIMTTIEQKEQERISREEEWRKQDAARIEMEHKFWASERAWIEARDSALMDAFHKMSHEVASVGQNQNDENQQKWEMVNNYVLKCNYNKKRNHDQSSICNQGGSSGGTFDEQGTIMRLNDRRGNSSEQGVDDHHTIRPNNDHQANSSHHHNGNAISESCFRYFMGDPYGRMLD